MYFIIYTTITLSAIVYCIKLKRENTILYKKLAAEEYISMDELEPPSHIKHTISEYCSNVSNSISTNITSLGSLYDSVISKISGLTGNNSPKKAFSEPDMEIEAEDIEKPIFREYEYRNNFENPQNVEITKLHWKEQQGHGYLDVYNQKL
jgi:hypothetical protein